LLVRVGIVPARAANKNSRRGGSDPIPTSLNFARLNNNTKCKTMWNDLKFPYPFHFHPEILELMETLWVDVIGYQELIRDFRSHV